MDFILQLLLWCPKCWRKIGYFLFSACTTLALLGWQLVRRMDRVEHRTGVVVDVGKVLDSLPLPIPSTPAGFALAAFGAMLGLVVAAAGKWAQKL